MMKFVSFVQESPYLKNLPPRGEVKRATISFSLGRLCVCVHVHKTCTCVLYVHMHTLYKT